MGNCQAAEAATVLIQHPGEGKRIERIYKSVSAKEVMNSNPGHYVALIVISRSETGGTPLKQLKLIRPDDTLHIGQVYRLVSFEEVLKEFAAKKCVKLGKLLLKDKEWNIGDKGKHLGRGRDSKQSLSTKTETSTLVKVEEDVQGQVEGNSNRGGRQHHYQWRPALESISEIGT